MDVSTHLVICSFLLAINRCAPTGSSNESGSVFINEELREDDGPISAEKRLLRKLLTRYNRVGKNGLPVRNSSQAVPVSFAIGLIQLELDEKNKMLATSTWAKLSWKDAYMTWKLDDYEGVGSISLDPSEIWMPDIMLYNTADVEIQHRHAQLMINHAGNVSWYTHSMWKSSCSIDVTNFPFDDQTCSLLFGSWTHTSQELNLDFAIPGGIDLSTFEDYKSSCAWEIVNVTSKREVLPSPDEVPSYIVLSYDIQLSRKIVFSTYILTLPCIFLACLTLVVFWLPPDRPDRTALAMSIFSSLMVLLLILVEAAPPTASSVPTLGVYYCFNMVIIMLAIILSSLVVNVSRCDSTATRVPRWLEVVVGKWVSRIVFLRSRIPPSMSRRGKSPSNNQYTAGEECDTTRFMTYTSTQARDPRDIGHANGNYAPSSCPSPLANMGINGQAPCNDYVRNLENEVRDLRKSLHALEDRVDNASDSKIKTSVCAHEWRFIGMVLDRFFFVLYLLLLVASMAALFPRHPLT